MVEMLTAIIIDDEVKGRIALRQKLADYCPQVEVSGEAGDGLEGLKPIEKHDPAIVFLDIQMPRMDGFEMLHQLPNKEQYRTLPVVMLTSRAAGKHQQRAMQLGASAYVVKPYQDEELISILNALVYGA